MMHIHAACRWHVGKVRTNNEDNFYFAGHQLQNCAQKDALEYSKALSARGTAFAVFDGMGGLKDGEKASQAAATCFEKETERLHVPVTEERLKEICLRMDATVTAMAEKTNNKMGTTAAVLTLSKNTAVIGNVGDSSVFLFRGNKLTCLSTEHSDRRIIEKLGIVGRTPALTQYIGAGTADMQIAPYATTRRILKEDRFVLCSDGLTDMLTQAQIAEICRNTSNAVICAETLVSKALEQGGRDNVTVIICDVV